MTIRGRARTARPGSVFAFLLVISLLLAAAGACSPVAVGTGATAAASLPAAAAARPTTDPTSGLATIAASDLPPEAAPVLAAIASGGPFGYSQDGVVFSNREGILPKRSSGYYREYTVPTPGSPDRGARRIVTGVAGEAYYTADHYASFRRVWP